MPRMGGHGAHGGMPGEKAKDFKGTLKKLFKYMGAFKVHMIFVAVLQSAAPYSTLRDRRSSEKRRQRYSTALSARCQAAAEWILAGSARSFS